MRLEFYKEINQYYIFEKDEEHTYRIENDRDGVEEGQILTLLEQNDNRIKLNEVCAKYKSMFNEEMPIPAEMKLWEFFEKFRSVELFHNAQNNQVYLILRPTNDLAKEDEKHILYILEHNGGCIGINDMVETFKRSHKRGINLPPAIKLVDWLCSLNSIVLIQKPNNNKIFLAIKHSIQCKYDGEVLGGTQSKGSKGSETIFTSKDDANVESNHSETTAIETNSEVATSKRSSSNTLTKRKRDGEEKLELQTGVSTKKATLSPNSPNTIEVKIEYDI